MNGYFQLDIRDDGTYLIAFPPTDGGAPISISEVTRYLNSIGIPDYDTKTLGDAARAEEKTAVRITAPLGYEESGAMDVDVSDDYMSAIARFYPPSLKGARLTKNDILATLKKERIRFGVDEEAIASFIKNPQYCTDYIIARGEPMVQSKNGSIEYFFETQKNLAPKLNEDGTVDYHELNLISAVNEGQLLARLTPPDPGTPGTSVRGEPVMPAKVNDLKLKFGKNVRISEDETEIYSMVEGHAMLTNDTVFVSDVYIVPANVDNSTGDVEYNGSVEVKGNVNSGFSVKAGGDIVVEGLVEGATLKAKGKIIVKLGVHGMSNALLVAGSSITVKFVENAEMYSDESINADSIIHSNISAKYDVRVMGKKGFIIGGMVRAGRQIVTQTLGSDLGALTKVEVGINTKKKKQLRDIENRLKSLEEEKNKIEPTINGLGKKVAEGLQLPDDKLAFLKSVAVAYQDIKKQMYETETEYAELMEEFEIGENANIEVIGDAYPGCNINISDAQKALTDKRSHCRMIKSGVDVKIDIL